MKRNGIRVDVEKARAWQQRSAAAYRANRGRSRVQPGSPSPSTGDAERSPQTTSKKLYSRRSQRRNDGPWRAACVDLYGEWCRACGNSREIQMDHMKPRSQGGRSDVENGLPLCRTHHEQKTHGTLQIRPEWLTAEQIRYLADEGWVAWDDAGEPHGHGWKHFAPRRSRDAGEKGGR